MRAALKLGDMGVITSTFAGCSDKQVKRQLAFMLARQGVVLDHEDGPAACPDDLEAIQVQPYTLILPLAVNVPVPVPVPVTSRGSCMGREAVVYTGNRLASDGCESKRLAAGV